MRRPWRKRTPEVRLPWLEEERASGAEPGTVAGPPPGESPRPEPPPGEPAPAGPPAVEAPPDPALAEPPFVAEHEAGSGAVSSSSLGPSPAAEPAAGDEAAGDGAQPRPEVLAGAAFAGGLVVAMLVRRVLS